MTPSRRMLARVADTGGWPFRPSVGRMAGAPWKTNLEWNRLNLSYAGKSSFDGEVEKEE